MKIAVNTRLLLPNRLEGIGWFTYETLKRIVGNHPEHEFFFLFDRPCSNEYIFTKNVTPVVLPPQSRHPVLWYIWFEFSVARFLRKNNIDIFISPDGYLSTRTKVPSIAVIHDINFAHHPEGMPILTGWYFNHFFPLFAKKAAHIVTVSEYSKSDIASTYNLPLDKISVAYNGVNPSYTILTPQEVDAERASLTEGKPYFLFVGAFNPRKNVARLIRAFDLFRQKHGEQYKLVLVGEKMFKTADIRRAYYEMEYKDDVVFTGRLNIARLQKVMGAAFSLVFVPYFEGFGIPLVEAMRCGVPIIASNRTSIPEVTQNAALLVDPFCVEEIAAAMIRLSTNPLLANELVSKGLERVKLFSWDITAERLWHATLQVASENGIL
ncbi:MAG TPA: glycosyltransferase family 1 protein [Williamwhitmania sp.]|nr:glycosyltransferase family 1 protein [Williamwhitmania sp.]